MSKIIKTLLIGLFLLPLSFAAKAQTQIAGTDITWKYENCTLYFSGKGIIPDYAAPEYQPWYNCGTVKMIYIDYGITGIGDRAFKNISETLNGVSCPVSLKSIGDEAFYGTKNMVINFASPYPPTVGINAFASVDPLTSSMYCMSFVLEEYEQFNTEIKQAFAYVNAFPAASSRYGDVSADDGSKVWYFFDSFSQSDSHHIFFYGNGQPLQGLSADFSYSFSSDFKASLTAATFMEGITTIPYATLAACSNITYIDLPASLIEVGPLAFNELPVLTEVNIADGSQLTTIGGSAFSLCKGLQSIKIPATVTSIGEHAFDGCSALDAVYMQDLPTAPAIGSQSFSGISSTASCFTNGHASWASTDIYQYFSYITPLKGGTFTEDDGTTWRITPLYTDGGEYEKFDVLITLEQVSQTAAYTKDTAPWAGYNNRIRQIAAAEGVTLIPDYAFHGFGKIISCTLPSTLLSIGNSAFESTTLSQIAFPTSLKSIGDKAFYYNSGITEITIPASVESIGTEAFSNCSALASVTFATDGALKRLPEKCFYDSYPSSVTLPGGLEEIGDFCFAASVNFIKPKLASITFPAALKTIGNHAFYQNKALKSVTFSGENLTTIGEGAFRFTGLTSLSLPNSVQTIGNSAFYSNAIALGDFTFPTELQYVGDGAFVGSSATSLTFGTKVTYIGAQAFTSLNDLTIKAFNITATVSGFKGTNLHIPNVAEMPAPFTDPFTTLVGNFTNVDYIYTIKDISANSDKPVIGWVLDGVLTIAGSGDTKNYTLDNHPAWEKAAEINVADGITSLGNYLFYDYGDDAIRLTGCTGLKYIGDYCFYRATIQHLPTELPEIMYIGDYSFYSTILSAGTYELGPNLEYIGTFAFQVLPYRITLNLHSNPNIQVQMSQEFVANLFLAEDADYYPYRRVTYITPSPVFSCKNDYNNVTFDFSIAPWTFRTVVLPFLPDEETFAAFNFYEFTDVSDGCLNFHKISRSTFSVGTPYLVANVDNDNCSDHFTASNVTVSGDDPTTVTHSAETHSRAVTDWTMIGTYGAYLNTDAGELANLYTLGSMSIEPAGTELSVAPREAYFQGPAGASMTYSFDNVPVSGVSDITADPAPADNTLYDLQGRTVRTPQPGTIYILNGRKIRLNP